MAARVRMPADALGLCARVACTRKEQGMSRQHGSAQEVLRQASDSAPPPRAAGSLCIDNLSVTLEDSLCTDNLIATLGTQSHPGMPGRSCRASAW